MREPPSTDPNTVLLVEDDRDVSDSIREVLEDAGYAVEQAATGEEALARMAGASRPPSIILLDLMMPVMDGWEFRKVQRNHPSWSRIPVVVISADTAVARKAVKLGAVAYLRKPVTIRALLDVLAQVPPATPPGAE